jgi:hypothetical protein
MARLGTTTSADFCSHDSGHPGRPAFQPKLLTHGYACRSPRIRDVNFHCASTRSTQEVVGNGFCSPRSAHPNDSQSLYRVSVRYPAVLATDSSPRFVASPQLPLPSTCILVGYIWYTVLQSSSEFVQGTCTPQVHAHVGRTDAREGSARHIKGVRPL